MPPWQLGFASLEISFSCATSLDQHRISLRDIYTYQGSPFEGQALSDVTLEIQDTIIGHTGGKVTVTITKWFRRPTEEWFNSMICLMIILSQKEMKCRKDGWFQFPEESVICRNCSNWCSFWTTELWSTLGSWNSQRISDRWFRRVYLW